MPCIELTLNLVDLIGLTESRMRSKTFPTLQISHALSMARRDSSLPGRPRLLSSPIRFPSEFFIQFEVQRDGFES